MELNDNSPPTLLVVLADFPGGHYRVAELLGNRLRSEGVRVAYLLTSPYVKRFKKVNLESVGPVYHLSDLRKAPADTDPQPASQWWMHPSFVRQEYYRGRSLVAPTDYGPIRHAIETVFDDLGKVDLVWSEPPTSATLCVLHDVCGARDVPYWGIGPARVPGHFHMSTDLLATNLVRSGGRGVPEDLPEGVPDYHRRVASGMSQELKIRELSSRLRNGLHALIRAGGTSIETGWGPSWQFAAIKRRTQRRTAWRIQQLRGSAFDQDVDCVPDGRKAPNGTFLFPLHVRPEASTSMWARFYEDDLQTLRNLAFSLPGGATLVVKEHPSAVGSRTMAFYRAIRRLPGVRLARPGFAASDHLHRFAGIIVLTSTLGFEALQRGVPVLTLGRVFYDSYPGAMRAYRWEDVARFYRLADAGDIATQPSEIWRLYREYCFCGSFDIMDPATASSANIEKLAAPLQTYLLRRLP